MLGIEWRWDWSAFWPQLLAGLVTFFLGVVVTVILLRVESWLDARREFRRFQELARQVLKDLRDIERVVQAWSKQAEKSERLEEDDIVVLTWEVTDVRAPFAARGVHLSIQVALNYFQEARRLAKVWNEERKSGALNEETRRRAQQAVAGTSVYVQKAIDEIEVEGRLRAQPSLVQRVLGRKPRLRSGRPPC